MNSPQYSLFPETVYEYFILISPTDEIKIYVDLLKQQLHGLIGLDPANLNSLAHITLFKYEGTDSMMIPDVVKRAIRYQPCFPIKIFGAGKNIQNGRGNVYLKIANPAPINELVKRLKPKFKKAPSKIRPHITLAKNLPQSDIEKIPDITLFDYFADFLCDRVTILRRPLGSTGWFSPVAEVKLEG